MKLERGEYGNRLMTLFCAARKEASHVGISGKFVSDEQRRGYFT
jgi:hypothetical protein